MYAQLAFALDRVKALAPQHPEWQTTGAVQGGARRRPASGVAAGGEHGHAGDHGRHARRHDTTDEFEQIVQRLDRDGEASRRSSRLYTELRLPADARAARATCAPTASRPTSSPAAASSSCGRGSSASTAFRRSRSSAAAIKMKYEMRDGVPVLVRLPEVDLHRRQGGQAGRHSAGHRPPADHRVRQLRRRLRDARVDHDRAGPASRPDRPPHRRRARVGLRPRFVDRPSGARPGRGRRRELVIVDMKRDWARVFP